MDIRRNTELTKILGQNLKTIRTDLGLSQAYVAGILGVSFQQIQKYESGANRLPAEKLYALHRHYALPFAAFYEGFDQDVSNTLINPHAMQCALRDIRLILMK